MSPPPHPPRLTSERQLVITIVGRRIQEEIIKCRRFQGTRASSWANPEKQRANPFNWTGDGAGSANAKNLFFGNNGMQMGQSMKYPGSLFPALPTAGGGGGKKVRRGGFQRMSDPVAAGER